MNDIDIALEQCSAKRDIMDVALQYGDMLHVYLRVEGDVNRDIYGDIKSGDVEPTKLKIPIPAFPITFNPNARQLEKAGVREECEFLCYTPYGSWQMEGYEFDDIDVIRSTVSYKGHKYLIKEKGQVGQFGGELMYITLALKRK